MAAARFLLLFACVGASNKRKESFVSGQIRPLVDRGLSEEYMIPLHLHFSYKHNLLDAGANDFTDQERRAADNIRRTISLNSKNTSADGIRARVTFHDDAACLSLLNRTVGNLEMHVAKETNGQRKAHICMVAAIYKHGGYFADPDLNFRLQMREFVQTDTTFISSYAVGFKDRFFQGFAGCTARHPIMRLYLDLMQEVYDGKYEKECFSDSKCNMGPRILYEAFSKWNKRQEIPNHVQILDEHWKQSNPQIDKAVPSQDGIGCCCDVVVFDPKTLAVPFYVRFPGHTWFCVDRSLVKDLPKEEPELCKELVNNGIDLGKNFCGV